MLNLNDRFMKLLGANLVNFRVAVFCFLIGFFVFNMSCEKKKVIDSVAFKEILLQIHECEAYNELKLNNVDTIFLNNCRASIFKNSKVSIEEYQRSLDYYKSNTEDFEEVYDSLLRFADQPTSNVPKI
jgi:hypothetical protein